MNLTCKELKNLSRDEINKFITETQQETSDAIKELGTLKEIINNNNNEVVFPLLGGEFKVSAERNIYVQYRKKYVELANITPATTLYFASKNLVKIAEDGRDDGKIPLLTCTADISKAAVNDAISVGLYSFDTKAIDDKCHEGSCTGMYDRALQHYVEGWFQIAEVVAFSLVMSSEEQHEKNIENLFPNRDAVLYDENAFKALDNGIKEWIINLHQIVLEAIEDEEINLSISMPNEDEIDKAAAAYRNFHNNNDIPLEQRREIIYAALTLNPYDTRLLHFIIAENPDNVKEFIDIANYFGILNEYLSDEIIDTYITLNIANNCKMTEKEAISSVEKVLDLFNINPEKRAEIVERAKNDFARELIGHPYRYLSKANEPMSIELLLKCKKSTKELAEKKNLNIDNYPDIFDILKERAAEQLVVYTEENAGITDDSLKKCITEIYEYANEFDLNSKQIAPAINAFNQRVYDAMIKYLFVETNIAESGIGNNIEKIINKLENMGVPLDNENHAIEIVIEFITEYLKKYAFDFIESSVEDVYKCKQYIENISDKSNLPPTVKSEIISIIDKKIVADDIKYRTVYGIIANTREEADFIRNLNLNTSTYIYRKEYVYAINLFQRQSSNSAAKEQIVNKLTADLNAFDSKLKKAARYEHFIKNKNCFWNGDMADTITAYVILFILFSIALNAFYFEPLAIVWFIVPIGYFIYMVTLRPLKHKHEWEELTHNGMYSLKDIKNS